MRYRLGWSALMAAVIAALTPTVARPIRRETPWATLTPREGSAVVDPERL